MVPWVGQGLNWVSIIYDRSALFQLYPTPQNFQISQDLFSLSLSNSIRVGNIRAFDDMFISSLNFLHNGSLYLKNIMS